MISEEQRYKNSTINGFFVETADHNYIVCRWCFLHGFFQDFYWNAMHAMEKYMKAALVLNGRSSKNYQHDLVRLLHDVREISGELVPCLLICPNLLNKDLWRTEVLDSFVRKIGNFGDPNGRYGLISNHQRPDDLMKVDAVIFCLRRIAVRLDDPWIGIDAGNGEDISNRGRLRRDPYWQPKGDIQKPRLRDAAPQEAVENTLLHHNFAFTDDPLHLTGRSVGTSARNSWLFLLAGNAEEEGVRGNDVVRANVIDWLTDHVSFPRSLTDELTTAARLLRQRASSTR